MFLVRSIRRRLVTGYTIALALLLFFAWAAVDGLLDHQAAVERLRTEVGERPDPDRLKAVVFAIQMSMYPESSRHREKLPGQLLRDLRKAIDLARTEAGIFWQRSEDAPAVSELSGRPGLRQVVFEGTMRRVQGRLDRLAVRVSEVDPFQQFPLTEKETAESVRSNPPPHEAVVRLPPQIKELQEEVSRSVARIIYNLDQLPVDTYVLATLDEEFRASRKWMNRILVVVGVSLLIYALTIYFGFRWISNPLRALAQGASRIANGDTDHRLELVTPWHDEFFDMTTNFNRMADRFQDSERDLAAKVEERSRQLVRSERLASVGCLAAGVAHEINNPLSAITIAAQSLQFRLMDVLEPDGEDTDVAMERLTMIQTESKRCGEITRRLLNFSRDEKQEKLPDDLTRVIGEVLAMVRPMSRYQDRTIVFDRVEPLIIEINASQMKQVMLNLITNGLQATSAQGEVQVLIREQTDWVVVEVIDNGAGITAEDRELMFEPFYSTKETGEGTGLGLSITNTIVQQHNGTIEPFSDGPGRGSRFSVRLPRKQPAPKAA